MFEVPGSDIKTVHITSACVKGKSEPVYIRNDENHTENDEDSESAKVRVTQ